MSLISRADRGLLAAWWFTVDRMLLTVVLLLMVLGALLSMAATPPVAERLNLDAMHFVRRHFVFLLPAVAVLLVTSLMSPRMVRRVCLLILLAGLGLMVMTIMVGPEVKGARRWLDLGPFSMQPSEFVKPAFVVITAWLFAESARKPEMPGSLIALALLGVTVSLLVLQPDYGQTVLIAAVWAVMLLLTGISWGWVASFASLGVGGAALAYTFGDHFASRINRFLNPEMGDTYQVDTALQAFERGGLFGVGPGGGSVKSVLPDAHSDFVFAVAGEEFGLVACLVLIGLFAFVVIRGLMHSLRSPDAFASLTIAGLTAIVGFQAVINMAVNISLIPAKGMTLPFVSYGGSSLLATAFAMGIVLSLSRRVPTTHTILTRPPAPALA